MAGKNPSVAKGKKNAQTQKSSAVTAPSRGNAGATQGGGITVTNRSNRPVHKSDRLLQQEEEQRNREEARVLKQQRAQQREATNKRRAQEHEDDANGDYLNGPAPVPRKKPNTSRPPSRPASYHEEVDNGGRSQTAGRLLPRQSGVAPPANTVPIPATKAKTATFRAPGPQNLFDTDEGVEHASRSDGGPPTSDVEMDFEADFDDADPPATTDDDGTSGLDSGEDDVGDESADEDLSGAITRVIATSKSSGTKLFDGTGDDGDDVDDEDGAVNERIVIRKRPKNSDLDRKVKTYVESSERHYRFLLATLDGFPDPNKALEFVREAVDFVCDKYKIQIPIDSNIEILLKARGPTMRGEIKTKARSLVALLYGIHEAASQPGGKKKVRELVYSLTDGHSFIYADTKNRKGAFLNDAIQFVVNESFFHNFNAIGIFYRHDFCKPDSGVSPNVIALVCAAIECCLHEWQSGERTKLKFSTERYAERYAVFCTLLGEIEARTRGEGIRRLGRRIAKRALKQAGVDPDGLVDIALGDNELDAAAAELGNLAEDEDEEDE